MEFPVEAGRYILYVSRACPWACRVLAVLSLRGLGALVRVVVVCPTWARTSDSDEHRGWVFRARAAAGGPDAAMMECAESCPLTGATTLRGVYEALCSEAGSPAPIKFTVPLLVDAVARRIVCNESSVLLRSLGGGPATAQLASLGALHLRPPTIAAAVDAECEAMYEAFNNGVYKCGFATTQAAYDVAARGVAAWLDAAEARLASDGRRFLCGDELTEADIRAYVTLVRYDAVYRVHFKCIFRAVRDLPALRAYTSRVHKALQSPSAVGGASGGSHPVTDMVHIKQHYFGSHPKLNPYGIVPAPAPGEGIFD